MIKENDDDNVAVRSETTQGRAIREVSTRPPNLLPCSSVEEAPAPLGLHLPPQCVHMMCFSFFCSWTFSYSSPHFLYSLLDFNSQATCKMYLCEKWILERMTWTHRTISCWHTMKSPAGGSSERLGMNPTENFAVESNLFIVFSSTPH